MNQKEYLFGRQSYKFMLIYARNDKVYEVEEARNIIKELIGDVKICRKILKNRILRS
ncbi:MAG: hypothetical protein Q8N79_08030 [Candidatus Methanoperedens sp.]|nr:hypothetical protein [Candidatus Methanoperedens sp.]